MKKILSFALVAFAILLSCDKFDDSAIWEKLYNHESRIANLEELCKQMNTNIASLQTLVTALQNNDYVTSVVPVTKNNETVGYTISFTKSQPITIYHGEDGKDGANGKDGENGKDGQDGQKGKDGMNGTTPVIGVKSDADGIYYWTLDGEWLLDDNGNKIPTTGPQGTPGKDGNNGKDGQDGKDGVDGTNGKDGTDGKDGITPQLKIENDYWYVSYDNGQTWEQLYKAVGDDGKDGADGADGKDGEQGVPGTDGKDGDSFFQNVDTNNPDYVIITLADGTVIKLPTWKAHEDLVAVVSQMNSDISALKKIVEALENKDYVTSTTPLVENGVIIG